MKTILIPLLLTLLGITLNAQSISVDMDPSTDGIQSSFKTYEEGNTFTIEIIGSDLTDVAAYQFKLKFDSTMFESVVVAEDYGMSGKINFLESNNATITKIIQPQENPACDTIYDVAVTMNGTSPSGVNGSGLLAVMQLKAKMQPSETGHIVIEDAFTADPAGTKSAVTTLEGGSYTREPPVGVSVGKTSNDGDMPFIFSVRDDEIALRISKNDGNLNSLIDVSLFSVNGRNIVSLENCRLINGCYILPLPTINGIHIIPGSYLLKVRYNKDVNSKIILVR